ncbi:MAG: hypothetical protein R2874_09270 [Desulfobacterales bacterium]
MIKVILSATIKGALKAHAELADQFRRQRAVLAFGIFQSLHKGGRAAFGDGPNVFHHFIIVSADAVI